MLRISHSTLKVSTRSGSDTTLPTNFKLLGLGENDWTRGSTRTPTRLLQDTVTQTFATSTSTDTGTSIPREDPSVTYQGLKSGNYTFLVKTYRKGWPYTSRPAAVNFTIATPFWAQWRSYLPYLILIGLLITIVPYLLARLVMNRRRVAQLHSEMQQKEEAEMQQLRAELDEARNMQAALLPTEVPEVEGLDVAGMSLPATQVGGDFYDYLNAGENHLAIAVADAAGKGLRGCAERCAYQWHAQRNRPDPIQRRCHPYQSQYESDPETLRADLHRPESCYY